MFLSGDLRFIIEAFNYAAFYFLAENSFDAPHHVIVFTSNECESVAGFCSAAGAANPVCVCVGGVRHVVVYDVGYA